ncbi:helix-turn-helix domain-containing protein [Mycobacterium sp. LTG2003]
MTKKIAGLASPLRSLEVRIAERITSDGSVVIPPPIAHWLEQNSGMTADRRFRLYFTDPEAYIALTALHHSARRYLAARRSECGTEQVAGQQNTTQSEMWLSTKAAAQALNVTDRCVRKWCTNGRLDAELVGARWLINPNSIALKDIA